MHDFNVVACHVDWRASAAALGRSSSSSKKKFSRRDESFGEGRAMNFGDGALDILGERI
jgi:hypothetical protein